MERPATAPGASEITFEAFGVRVHVDVGDPGLMERVWSFLPPGWQACARGSVETSFGLRVDAAGTASLARDGAMLAENLPLDVAFDVLEREVRMVVALRAPDHVFVHAGVVAVDGSAIVLPGASFAGKTTMVAALVRAGATYYSDEYAVLDREGRVHPYARPLAIRTAGSTHEAHPVESLGGRAGAVPAAVGAVVLTRYSPGAEWHPQRLSPGEAVLSLLENTLPAQTRPDDSLQALARSVDGALLIESERGDADAAAGLLLAALKAETRL